MEIKEGQRVVYLGKPWLIASMFSNMPPLPPSIILHRINKNDELEEVNITSHSFRELLTSE